MTEKELHEPTDSEMSDQSIQEEASLSDQVALDEDGADKAHPVEESQEDEEQTTESDSDESDQPSEFLLKWQERHEAYLAEQTHKNDVSVKESEAGKDATSQTPSLFAKRRTPKMDSLSISAENVDEFFEHKKQKEAIDRGLIWKTVPIISLALSFVVICLYFITPLGKLKQLIVTGNHHVESSKIVQDSLIMREDYILSTFLNKSGHENNIKYSSPWIKDVVINYTFPNTFTITVQEYSQIGFVKLGESYYSVLSSGEVSEIETPLEQLPATYTTIHLTDRELIKKLVLQLATINPAILADIQDIQLTPSKATNDLLTLTMVNGHKVLVPLSDIDYKLPYYEKIAPQLQVASVIDMEVGIFSYASQ